MIRHSSLSSPTRDRTKNATISKTRTLIVRVCSGLTKYITHSEVVARDAEVSIAFCIFILVLPTNMKLGFLSFEIANFKNTLI